MHAMGDDPTLEICAACGGVWMSNAVAVVLVKGLLPAELVDPLGAPPTHTGTRDAYREGAMLKRSCPECGEPLIAAETPAKVEVDICAKHGVYFDRHELGASQAFYVKKRQQERDLEYADKRAFLEELHAAVPDDDLYRRNPIFSEVAAWLHRWHAVRKLNKEYDK